MSQKIPKWSQNSKNFFYYFSVKKLETFGSSLPSHAPLLRECVGACTVYHLLYPAGSACGSSDLVHSLSSLNEIWRFLYGFRLSFNFRKLPVLDTGLDVPINKSFIQKFIKKLVFSYSKTSKTILLEVDSMYNRALNCFVWILPKSQLCEFSKTHEQHRFNYNSVSILQSTDFILITSIISTTS
jgi:hypothetical protein